VLAVEISDVTGDLTALFYGRSHIPGLICGARVRFRGAMGIRKGSPVMINPAYELLAPGDVSPPAGEGSCCWRHTRSGRTSQGPAAGSGGRQRAGRP
jgi:hypothetical protein